MCEFRLVSGRARSNTSGSNPTLTRSDLLPPVAITSPSLPFPPNTPFTADTGSNVQSVLLHALDQMRRTFSLEPQVLRTTAKRPNESRRNCSDSSLERWCGSTSWSAQPLRDYPYLRAHDATAKTVESAKWTARRRGNIHDQEAAPWHSQTGDGNRLR
jgi:hypothetical protein